MILAVLQIIMYLVVCFFTILIYIRNQKNKMPLNKIFFISILFVMYNVICTNLSTRMVGDRPNYLYEFLGYRNTSVGLSFIFNFVKLFTNNINYCYYLITFICCFITFFCITRDKNSNMYSLIFLLCTDFVFFTFFALKQCFVCAISCLIYYIICNTNKKTKYILSIILIYIACLFHSTGFLLIPVLIFLYLYREKRINPLFVILIFSIFLLFFNKILLILSNVFAIYAPSLSDKINEYFYTSGVYTDSRLIFLKGIPFYFVCLISTLKYKVYKKINNYDKLLILGFIGSIAYFISFISYWMYRITAMFYLPLALLFGILIKNEKNNKDKILYLIIAVFFNFMILVRWLYIIFMSGGF